jgi:hypothetical protein
MCLFASPRFGRGAEAQPGPDEKTRAEMHEIFAALAEILPRSLSEERFEAPGEREVVREQLGKLAQHADALSTHLGARHAGFELMGRSLARDARQAESRFRAGRSVDARFVVLHLTESCVGCHSRLPSDKDAPFAAKLIERTEVAKLAPHERARLAVATRQFDKALELYEGLLTSPPPSEGEAVRGNDLTEYLIVALRVKRDPERASALLRKLEQRAETPPQLKREIATWLETLKREGKAVNEKPTLARARALVEAGRRARAYPYSRAGLMHDLIASALLHPLVAESGASANERAEAYYLLGVTDSAARSSPWLSDAEYYLETAIETAPHTHTAREAFDAYEDMVLLEWSGSAGTEVPSDVAQQLDRLRGLAAPKSH